MLIMYTTKLLMSKFHQPMPDCLWVYKGMNTKKVNMLWWETRRFSLRALVSGIPPPPPPFPQDQAHGREFKGHVLIWVSLTVFWKSNPILPIWIHVLLGHLLTSLINLDGLHVVSMFNWSCLICSRPKYQENIFAMDWLSRHIHCRQTWINTYRTNGQGYRQGFS